MMSATWIAQLRQMARQIVQPGFRLASLVAGALALTQLSYAVSPSLGVASTALTLAACLAVALQTTNTTVRELSIAVGIVPTAQLVALALPQEDTFDAVVVFYNVLLVLGLAYQFMFGNTDKPTVRTSWREYLRQLPTLLVLGQLLGVIGFLLSRGSYAFNGVAFGWVVASSLTFAVAEEVVLRGLLQRRASQLVHPALAAALSTVVMGILSFGQGSWAGLATGLLSGSVLSVLYARKQNLVLNILVNMVAKLVFLGLLANFAWGYFR